MFYDKNGEFSPFCKKEICEKNLFIILFFKKSRKKENNKYNINNIIIIFFFILNNLFIVYPIPAVSLR